MAFFNRDFHVLRTPSQWSHLGRGVVILIAGILMGAYGVSMAPPLRTTSVVEGPVVFARASSTNSTEFVAQDERFFIPGRSVPPEALHDQDVWVRVSQGVGVASFDKEVSELRTSSGLVWLAPSSQSGMLWLTSVMFALVGAGTVWVGLVALRARERAPGSDAVSRTLEENLRREQVGNGVEQHEQGRAKGLVWVVLGFLLIGGPSLFGSYADLLAASRYFPFLPLAGFGVLLLGVYRLLWGQSAAEVSPLKRIAVGVAIGLPLLLALVFFMTFVAD